MAVSGLLQELFGRVEQHVPQVLDNLSAEDLNRVPEEGSNPIGWLVWHLTRVADMHIAEIRDAEQLWVSDGFGSCDV